MFKFLPVSNGVRVNISFLSQLQHSCDSPGMFLLAFWGWRDGDQFGRGEVLLECSQSKDSEQGRSRTIHHGQVSMHGWARTGGCR